MKKFTKSVSVAFIAQIVSLLVSAFMSFFVSKFMTVEMYGYYQLFLFCTTYVGIFQLGISEGNYLENGGKLRSELDKGDLKNQFISMSIFQIILLGILFAGISLLETNSNKVLVYSFAILYSIAHLWVMFFGLTLQAINETEKYSVATIVGKLITLVLFVAAVIMKKGSYVVYSLVYLLGYVITGVMVACYGKEILLCKEKFHFNLREHKKTIIAGSSLLFATLISSFIVGINRIYIERFLGIEVFGRVSMSLSLCNFFILFAIQFGMVMFPNIINLPGEKQKTIYSILNTIMPYMAPALIIVYIPLGFLLEKWLPNYVDSIHWILIFLPYIVYEIKNQIIYYTYIKILRAERYMLRINIAAFVACAVINLILIMTTKNVELVFIVLNIVLIAKSFLLERKVSSSFGIGNQDLSIIEALICVTATFIAYHFSSPLLSLTAVLIYIILFVIQKKRHLFDDIRALRSDRKG